MLLKDKIAVVTGAGNGIGKSIADLFLENGAKVVGLDIVDCASDNPDLTMLKVNVSDFNDCQRVVEEIFKLYDHVDVLVNCAGITRDAMTKKMTEEQFDQVISVNLKGVWNLTKMIGPAMQERGYGSIISISSVVGIYGNIGQSNYAATKAGVIGMTKSWAKEFARKGENVRVNAVAPGYTMTNMMKTVPEDLLNKFKGLTMLGRLAEPIEIANAVLFLASDMSSYITGEVLNVNGGMRL
ncbi:MAG: SDR family oxidoreductase [Oscillospiraceae bacterium]|jgi:3-oxoacyl-[acyl-carrier protein] reductase|nr:SDR family oxidoreductase [Oscillospiraceae bacterium]MCR5173822.1 SDR family oxidoreductase [Oscillospiraceae bacterium]